nr:hypothetical protein [Luteibacter sp. ME-Dv--P-043b]
MIDHLDHIVLTCTDPEATTHFYVHVLRMKKETFRGGRVAFLVRKPEDQPARERP